MAERLMKAKEGSLPKIGNFRRVVEAAPVGPNTINPFKFFWIRAHDFFSPENQIAKAFPEAGLDQMYTLWHGFETTEKRTQRLVSASQLPSLPELEKKDIDEVAQKNGSLISQFRDNLTLFIAGNFKDWSLAERAMNAAVEFEAIADEPRENQITAFCEAVDEVSTERELTPEFIRQRIAQWLIDEMFTEGAQYAALYLNTEYDDPTSLRDYIELEKDELKAALHDELWSTETLHRREGEFKRLLNTLYKGDYYRSNYSPENADILAFKELWSAAKGTAAKLKAVSAIKLMDDQYQIYESLRGNQVFDIELSEDEADLE
ncbi:hypothetical protein A2334_03450 [Candidatus Roizmanbacteria bacterium RIFOXYB2_FULL_38_10]|uniref:Uncharacterized protein n=1 Tax=Candidatus Roizmanbacteria bacterium RIFOXYD1_FULL_38_12 TaxID=1802093 RepID=A0A1F7L0Z5_9BACT|nr:MAG: hypothetical protein A3K47_03395 [Candidatus Roizmanbacteria bacterium RIFOXYA2_FULL_38_14]OGK63807.1 MAG: hypothetical protein A3K27_03395 [Candidatus Roizmanbacteria bacterium RIFOXYA1_FULL_37_12]OGK65653.1 MAG: hypothetical protein A3K38_03395 [Candidatus Roizmanbacteria bacterium RIFOXYB1_FULL_40_23]OGK67459.1 MAG: hypothetical protein A2334_03450 [Candidatus Roizmanbacteria bacterium RIFOXYB2_FULL_38_10]OGK70058.1 MAG: hypothetical protein A3K21_03400 [Candidatus Roizmanbacteria ba